MSLANLAPMSAEDKVLVGKLTEAWAEGEARAYLHAYKEVMAQLQEMNSKHLLVSLVNNLLARMKMHKLPIHGAAKDLMREMDHPRSRMFVMAAAVDVAIHRRDPAIKVKQIPDWEETLKAIA